MQRRHRFKPEPKDIRASNSPATLAVLERLQEYRYLPVDHLAAVTGFSYKYIKRHIIPTLFNEGYVFMPPEAKQSYLAHNRPRVLAITDKGEIHLKDYCRWRQTVKRKLAFRHTFNGELSRASFEIATREVPHLHLVKGAEILAGKRCPPGTRDDITPFIIPVNGHTIRPDDDLMGYRYSPPNIQPRWLFWLREDDRDTEDYATIRHKIRDYLAIEAQHIYRSRYGVPNCYYAFITINPARAKGILDCVMQETKKQGSETILVKSISDFASYDTFPPATGHMARIPWQRAGYKPINLLTELGVVEL